MRKFALSLLFVFFIGYLFPVNAQQVKITNEMIYQKLIEIEKRQAIFEERLKQIDKRFEQTDKQLELLQDYMDKRFDDVNKRFDQLYNFLWIITGIFTTLTLGVIGFAYLDRRKIIKEKLCLV